MLRTPGLESSGGPLGMGLSVAVGRALGLRYKRDPRARVFCILGDGESNEGNVWEAAMAAAHYQLDNLIAVVDYNKVMAKGFTHDQMSIEPFADKWRAFGWEVIEVDGHDIDEVADAFHRARWILPHGQPIVVIAHTVKGKGVEIAEFNPKWHTHAPDGPTADRMLRELARRYGYPEEGYCPPPRPGGQGGLLWRRVSRPERRRRCATRSATRSSSWVAELPRIIVLDADLNTSSKTDKFKDAFPTRFIQVGIAEQDLFGIAAGLALEGFIAGPVDVRRVRGATGPRPDRHLHLLPGPERQDPGLVRGLAHQSRRRVPQLHRGHRRDAGAAQHARRRRGRQRRPAGGHAHRHGDTRPGLLPGHPADGARPVRHPAIPSSGAVARSSGMAPTSPSSGPAS